MNAVITDKTLGGLKVVPVQKRSPYLNMMVYGDSGVGKTLLAGSADDVPELSPAVVIDIEGGTESLVRKYPNVDVVRVTTWDQMQAVYDELYKGSTGYQTVILDSLTEIQKFNMYTIMEDLMKKRPDLDQDVPSMREWGKNLEQMRRMVRAFRDLPIHTVFTALAKEDKDDLTGKRTTLPSLSGKLAQEVAAFLDIVCYYYVKRIGKGDEAKDSRLLLTRKTEKIIAKDRTDRLPQIIEDPVMQGIFDYVLAPEGVKETAKAKS